VTLIDVFRVNEAYVLRYDHSDTSFTVMQGPSPVDARPDGQATEVTVRGQAATLIADPAQENRFLTWAEDGMTVVIAGRIGQDDILQVAESLR
jgi:hypothetical protein